MADEKQGPAAGKGLSPLQSERGITIIEDPVVAKVAGIAAQEIDGVRMGTGTSRTIGGIVDTVTRGGGERRGVGVEVGKIEAAVDLTMAILYGKSIPAVTEDVRNNVIRRIETLVGLRVTEVNIVVDDIFFEGEATEAVGEGEELVVRDQKRVR